MPSITRARGRVGTDATDDATSKALPVVVADHTQRGTPVPPAQGALF